MSRTRVNFSFAITASMLLTVPALAQGVEDFSGTHLSQGWPSGAGSSGTFGRIASARLTPGPVPEVVVQDGNVATVFVDADRNFLPVALEGDVVDLAAVRNAEGEGRDALVLLEPTGLSWHTFNAATWSFETQTLGAPAAWAGASLMRSEDLDGDGADDLVALAADGFTLLTLVSAGGTVPVQAGSIESSWDVLDIVPLEWDGDAELEFGVLSNWGVEVLDGDGAVLDSWSNVLAGDAIARIQQDGMATDRIVWITAYAPPAKQLLMTLAPGGAVHDQVNLGALDAFAVVGGDYDLDGDDDVLISHRFSNELIWLENQRTAAQPNVASFPIDGQEILLFRVGPPGSGATLNRAWPIMDDLDADGDLDVFYAAETTMTVDLMRGETIDEDGLRPAASGLSWDVEAGANEGTLHLELQAPESIPANATHVRLDLWHRADLSGPIGATGELHVELALPASWPLSVDLTLDESSWEFEDIYALELRLIEIDANGERPYDGPPLCGSLSMGDASEAGLLADPQALASQEVPGNESASQSGVFVARPRFGAFDQGSVPLPGVGI